MFVCCVCCVLSVRGLCDELITSPEEFYRPGPSLWVIKKSREMGGHSPRWAAEPEKIIIINYNKVSVLRLQPVCECLYRVHKNDAFLVVHSTSTPSRSSDEMGLEPSALQSSYVPQNFI
jgi:hypothetical protein